MSLLLFLGHCISIQVTLLFSRCYQKKRYKKQVPELKNKLVFIHNYIWIIYPYIPSLSPLSESIPQTHQIKIVFSLRFSNLSIFKNKASIFNLYKNNGLSYLNGNKGTQNNVKVSYYDYFKKSIRVRDLALAGHFTSTSLPAVQQLSHRHKNSPLSPQPKLRLQLQSALPCFILNFTLVVKCSFRKMHPLYLLLFPPDLTSILEKVSACDLKLLNTIS